MKWLCALLLLPTCLYGQAFSFRDLPFMAPRGGVTITTALQSFWHLDEPIQNPGTHKSWADSGPANNTLIASNVRATTPNEGIADKAEFLVASDVGQGCLLTTNISTVSGGSGRSFTMQIWFRYYDNAPVDDALIGKWHRTGDGGTAADQDYVLYVTPQGVVFSVRNLAATVVTVTNTSMGPIHFKNWYHVVAGYDNALQQIWVQGTCQTNAVGVRDSTACVGVQSTSVLFALGNYTTTVQAGTGGDVPRMDIDEAGFWARSLSLTEVTNLYADSASWIYPFAQTAGQQLATRWAGAVVNAGGAAVGSATTNAVAMLSDGFITNFIMHKQYSYCLFVPDNLTAARVPGRASTYLVHYENGGYPEGGSVPYANSGSFVSGDLTVNGLTGNGSTKYLDSGFNSLTGIGNPDNAGISLYGYATTSGAYRDSGDYVLATDASYGLQLSASDIASGAANSGVGQSASGVSVHPSPGNGFYSGNRVSNTDHRLYFANSLSPFAQIGFNATARSVTLLNGTVALFASNIPGLSASYEPSPNTLSYSSFHQGFSSPEAQAEYNAVQAARVTLGGGSR